VERSQQRADIHASNRLLVAARRLLFGYHLSPMEGWGALTHSDWFDSSPAGRPVAVHREVRLIISPHVSHG